jgi:hypothetical protein
MDFQDGPAAQPSTNPTTQRKVIPALRRARARSSRPPRPRASVVRSMVSWVMFVLMTAVAGASLRASLTSAFW